MRYVFLGENFIFMVFLAAKFTTNDVKFFQKAFFVVEKKNRKLVCISYLGSLLGCFHRKIQLYISRDLTICRTRNKMPVMKSIPLFCNRREIRCISWVNRENWSLCSAFLSDIQSIPENDMCQVLEMQLMVVNLQLL